MLNTDNTQQENQESLLARALASTANAIFITDETGKIVWINQAFSKASGYSNEDTIGRTPAILQSGQQSHSFYTDLWQTIRDGKVWQGEVVDQRKDGTLYTVDEIITPLFDEQGAITHFIAIQHDISRRQKEAVREHHLAYHDVLTGLPNRIKFLEVQQREISNAKRTKHMLATLFLDLDKFKPVNDKQGHHMGDQLLAAVAERLRSSVRQADVVARFGGDEFAILLTQIPAKEVATTLAQKLVDVLSRPFVLRGQIINISASIGIAIYPTDGEDPEMLLMHADKAMYQAKCRGGSTSQLFDPNFSVTT